MPGGNLLRRTTVRRDSGFTLLELILALSLSVVILMAIGMAVHLHLRSLDSQREELEESQLARSVLRIFANDIRSVALRYEQDVSAVEELLKGATQAASGGGGSGGGGSGSGGSGGGGSSGGGSGGGGSSGGGQSGSSGQSGGSGGEPSATESDQQASTEGEASTNTQDLSTSAVLQSTPGIYGNQFELQIDISRLPRTDEYQQMYQTESPSALSDIPSDTKSVTYYVQAATTAPLAFAEQGAPLAQLTDPNMQSGLVRRELDRAVTTWAMTNSTATMLTQTGEVLAPEVAGVEFQYFDGYEWRLEWDTQAEQALPAAIQITLAMQSMEQAEASNQNVFMVGTQDVQDLNNIRYYRLVVQLPVSMPEQSTQQAGTESMEGTGL